MSLCVSLRTVTPQTQYQILYIIVPYVCVITHSFWPLHVTFDRFDAQTSRDDRTRSLPTSCTHAASVCARTQLPTADLNHPSGNRCNQICVLILNIVYWTKTSIINYHALYGITWTVFQINGKFLVYWK